MPTFTEVKDLLGEAAAKVAGAKAANADDALTREEKKTRIEGLLAEANSLKGRAIQLQALEQAAGEIAAAKGAATANAKEGTKGGGGPSQFKERGAFQP